MLHPLSRNSHAIDWDTYLFFKNNHAVDRNLYTNFLAIDRRTIILIMICCLTTSIIPIRLLFILISIYLVYLGYLFLYLVLTIYKSVYLTYCQSIHLYTYLSALPLWDHKHGINKEHTHTLQSNHLDISKLQSVS